MCYQVLRQVFFCRGLNRTNDHELRSIKALQNFFGFFGLFLKFKIILLFYVQTLEGHLFKREAGQAVWNFLVSSFFFYLDFVARKKDIKQNIQIEKQDLFQLKIQVFVAKVCLKKSFTSCQNSWGDFFFKYVMFITLKYAYP